MHRFLVASLDSPGNKLLVLDKKQIHHIKNVLCLRPGEKVVLFDGKGSEALAGIERLSTEGIRMVISKKIVSDNKRKLSLTVACALPKNSRFDDIVDKLTQLEVDRIIPLKTERTQVKPSQDSAEVRLGRWKKIALSAAQQSRRIILPQIDRLTDLTQLLKDSAGFDLKFIPYLKGERKTLKEALSHPLPAGAKIIILIGPEGDFSPKEVALALKNGFIPVSLGPSVLRVETAAVSAAAFINLYEDR
jgi:16S rRNA (uracil1498-N3)-methyltransferase